MNEFPITPKVVTFISAHTLTAAYTDTGAQGYAETGYANYLGLLIKYTKGDETGVLVEVSGTADKSLGILASTSSLSAATNWFQRVAESTTGGTTTLTADVFEMIATGNYSEVISPLKGDGVRVRVKTDTIGVSPGTVTVYGIVSWA